VISKGTGSAIFVTNKYVDFNAFCQSNGAPHRENAMPTPTVNSFFWYDVMTTDTAAATKFYADVVGWTPQDSGSPGYTALTVDGVGTAGLMAVPEDAARAPTTVTAAAASTAAVRLSMGSP